MARHKIVLYWKGMTIKMKKNFIASNTKYFFDFDGWISEMRGNNPLSEFIKLLLPNK